MAEEPVGEPCAPPAGGEASIVGTAFMVTYPRAAGGALPRSRRGGARGDPDPHRPRRGDPRAPPGPMRHRRRHAARSPALLGGEAGLPPGGPGLRGGRRRGGARHLRRRGAGGLGDADPRWLRPLHALPLRLPGRALRRHERRPSLGHIRWSRPLRRTVGFISGEEDSTNEANMAVPEVPGPARGVPRDRAGPRDGKVHDRTSGRAITSLASGLRRGHLRKGWARPSCAPSAATSRSTSRTPRRSRGTRLTAFTGACAPEGGAARALALRYDSEVGRARRGSVRRGAHRPGLVAGGSFEERARSRRRPVCGRGRRHARRPG